MIGVVDYGAGNLRSVQTALGRLGALVRFVTGPAAQAIRRGLALRRILVRDRSDQAGLRGTLRIGIGTEEQAAATLAAVRGALADLSGAA